MIKSQPTAYFWNLSSDYYILNQMFEPKFEKTAAIMQIKDFRSTAQYFVYSSVLLDWRLFS